MRKGLWITGTTAIVMALGLGVASARSVDSLRPPAAVRALAVTDTSVTLAWGDSNNRESGYEVARSQDPNSGFVVVARPRRNRTTVTIGGLTPGTTYYFTVRARGRQQRFSATAQPLEVRTTGGARSDPGESPAPTPTTEPSATPTTTTPTTVPTTTTVPQSTDDPGAFPWAQSHGGTGSDGGHAVAVDSGGGIVMAGSFTGTADFGTGSLTANGSQSDVFVAKYTAAGAPMWSKRFGGSGIDAAYAVAIDRSANCDEAGGTNCIVITGMFGGTADFGGGPVTSAGSYDIFLAKYSASGAHVWSKRFGNTSDDIGQGVAVDQNGNVYLAGVAYLTDFGGGELRGMFYDQDAIVAKFSSTGAYVWAKNWWNTSRDWANAIAIDANGDVAITGMFFGSIDFGTGQMNAGSRENIFVAKLSGADGHALWAKSFGGQDVDRGYGIAFDHSGNVFVTGSIYNGTATFGSDQITSGYQQVGFMAKLSAAAGAPMWAKRIGNPDVPGSFHNASGSAVTVDGYDNVTVTGLFDGSVDFGGGALTAAGSSSVYSDAFVANYSKDGAYRWAKRFGGKSIDVGWAVTGAGADHVVATGSFGLSADFDGSTLTSVGGDDAYLVQLHA